MKCRVVCVGFRTRVAASALGQLDPAQILHVGAIVQVTGVASGRVANDQPDRAALFDAQGARTQLVDNDPLALDRLERHADVEVVAIGVQGSGTSQPDALRLDPELRPASRRRPAGWHEAERHQRIVLHREMRPGRRTQARADARPRRQF